MNVVPNPCVNGMVTSLSRVKKGKNSDFLDGVIYDGDLKMRFVGFVKEQQKRMSRFYKEQKIVKLYNCQLKKGRNSEYRTGITHKSKEDQKGQSW